MKKLSIVIASLLVMTLSGNVMADGGSTSAVNANATATIVTPIKITESGTLDFGKLASSTAAGTAVLTPGNILDVDGGITEVSTSSTAVPTYTVTGESGALYTVTLPGNNVVTLKMTGADDMAVTDFTTSLSGELTSQTLTGGSVTFQVGATLNVGISQAAGTYIGTYDVTVAYN
ncbi:MAG: DUF4402 domain-containing protein [Lentimicrobiaceae bacterium]